LWALKELLVGILSAAAAAAPVLQYDEGTEVVVERVTCFEMPG
jgi:hypothetical protein